MKKIRWRDIGLSLGILALTTLVCCGLSTVNDDNNPFAVPLYILAVAVISRLTEGYFCGIASAALSVFAVNYMFTYPFFRFNITLTGYPLTFLSMLLVSVMISALTTQSKQQERLKYEAEREKMRANLLRGVSHDIRTPLASMIGASSAILENADLPAEDRDALLCGINRDAKWLVRVVENLLSVTRFSGDGVELKKEDEVVEEIVGSAVSKYRRNRGTLPVRVEQPEEVLLVPMDGTLIVQVLVNLLDNAVDHAEGATGILLSVRRGKDSVLFSVSDDGRGFPPEVLPRVLSGDSLPADRDTSGVRRNMGIGLSVCNSIIRAHGGSMIAKNNAQGGATVSFRLPGGEEQKDEIIG